MTLHSYTIMEVACCFEGTIHKMALLVQFQLVIHLISEACRSLPQACLLSLRDQTYYFIHFALFNFYEN